MKLRIGLFTAAVLGAAVYVVVFYLSSLSSLRAVDDAEPVSRSELIFAHVENAREGMISSWFGSPMQFTFADRLPVLLAASAILAWAFLAGRIVLTLGGIDRRLTRLEALVFSTVVGLNLLSTWMLVMGLMGRMGRLEVVVGPMLVTLLLGAVVAWRRRNTAAPVADVGSDSTPGAGLCGHAWLWLAMPFVAVILLAAMLPPTDFDVCVYHLQAPKEFFEQGKITFLPHNVYANMPLGSEMLSLLAMLTVGDWWWGALAGKVVIAAFTPLCAAAIYAAGCRLHSTSAGVVAAIVFMSIPWVVCLSSAGLVEGVVACYSFLAIYALLLPDRDEDPIGLLRPREQGSSAGMIGRGVSVHRAALSGYLVGAAVATKYPAVLFVLIPLAAWIALVSIRRGLDARINWPAWLSACRASVKALLVFLLAVTVGCGLWFGKNWVQTGNPTYPLLYGVFGGETRTAEKDQQWNAAHRPDDFSPATFANDMTRLLLTSEWISPLLVPLVVLAFVRGNASRLAWALLLYVGFFIVAWWLLTHRLDRFWMPVTPVVALLAGVGACWSSERSWRYILLGLLVVVSVTTFLLGASGPANAWFVPLAKLRNSDDPNWLTPWHAYLNSEASSGAVLTVGDPAVFDLKPKVYYDTCFDGCLFEQWVKGKTPDEIRHEFAARDIKYVLVDWGRIAQFRKTYGFSEFVTPAVFEKLEREGILRRLRSVEDPFQRVYRVVDAPSR